MKDTNKDTFDFIYVPTYIGGYTGIDVDRDGGYAK